MESLDLLFTMLIKMNIFCARDHMGLFHYTLVGINMELLCSFRIKSISCTKIQLFPGHYMTSVSLYNV
jgi:hypothetical protein